MATITKPPFLGYGTPFLSIYDYKGELILDKITTELGEKPLAISDFSYTFNETEDDKGSITLWSNSPAFLDNFNVRHRGVLYLEWGYLNGDTRPKLRVLIRNFKEKYNNEGYKLILEISDNYAPAKNSLMSVRAKLEDIRDYMTGVTDPDSAAKIEAFLNPIEKFRPRGIKYEESSNNYEPSSGRWVGTGSIADAEKDLGVSLPLNTTPENPINNLMGKYQNPSQPKEVGAIDKATFEFYESLGYPPGYIPNTPVDEVDTAAISTKPPLYAEGKNATSLVQDMVDKVSDEPTGVTGSDGKIKIFKKRRASLFPPITEYTFKGGDGRLLEFDYDSDATYDEDESVLKTIGINPETGALEQTEYANSLRKIEDAYTPFQYEQLKFDARVYEAYMDYILKGGETSEKSGLEIIKNSPMLIQNPSTMLANGGFISAMDQTAVVTVFKAMPMSYRKEALEHIENEIRNLKGDASFRVRATAKTLGDPSISNGVNISILGLSKKRSGTYHITSCTHSINNSGYTNSYEMYKVSDIPVNTDVIKTSTDITEIKGKVDDIKKKQSSTPNFKALLESQGYILPSQIQTTDYYEAMDKLDKDWITKVGYTDYEISYMEIPSDSEGKPLPLKGVKKSIVLRVPNDPRSGLTPPLNEVFTIESLSKVAPNSGTLNYDVRPIRKSKRQQ